MVWSLAKFIATATLAIGAMTGTALADLAKTLVDIDIQGKLVRKNSYVDICYDAGNTWALRNLNGTCEDDIRVLKTAVSLVNVVFFRPMPTGRIKEDTPAYGRQLRINTPINNGNLYLPPTTKEKLSKGTEVKINAHLYDDTIDHYSVMIFGEDGKFKHNDDIPASALEIISGEKFKESSEHNISKIPYNLGKPSNPVMSGPNGELTTWWIWTVILFPVVPIIAWMQRRYAKETPTLRETAENLFPGFIVRDGDFVSQNNELYRVNSDGFRIALRKWYFDVNTGEFYRIKKTVGNNIIYKSESYKYRFVKWHDFRGKIGIYIGYIITLIASIIFGSGLKSQILAHSVLGEWFFGFFYCCFVLSCGLVTFELINPKQKLLGPEPLQRLTEDFGASKPEAPTEHPAQDDLGYRPNA